MPLPNCVLRPIRAFFDLKFCERLGRAIGFEMIQNTLSYYSVDQPLKFRRLELAVRNQMKVIQHNDIRKDEKAVLVSRFTDRIANDPRDGLRPKNREPVFR